ELAVPLVRPLDAVDAAVIAAGERARVGQRLERGIGRLPRLIGAGRRRQAGLADVDRATSKGQGRKPKSHRESERSSAHAELHHSRGQIWKVGVSPQNGARGKLLASGTVLWKNAHFPDLTPYAPDGRLASWLLHHRGAPRRGRHGRRLSGARSAARPGR